MRDATCFALAADGRLLATGDGPEVFVYEASTGRPLWKHFCEGLLVGARFAGPHLVVVDVDSQVTFFRSIDGQQLDSVSLDTIANGAIVSPDGEFACVNEAGVVVVRSTGENFGYPMPSTTAASFGPDRNSLGIGNRDGIFTAMDGTTGMPWGSVNLGAPISGVAWNARGFWVVSAGNSVFTVDGGASTVSGTVSLDGLTTGLRCTTDGVVALVVQEDNRIAVIELNADRVAGFISTRRPISEIEVSGGRLGIGLDDGDASTVDLFSRATSRTEPHQGRGRNNWNLDLDYDPSVLAGAAAFLKSGGAPIAEQQFAPDDPLSSGGRSGCMKVGCTLMSMSVFAVSGCAGLAFVLKILGII